MGDRELRIEKMRELIRLNKNRRRAEKIFDDLPFVELVHAGIGRRDDHPI
jgi:hypothetical protein